MQAELARRAQEIEPGRDWAFDAHERAPDSDSQSVVSASTQAELWSHGGITRHGVGVRDLLGSLVRGPKLASPAKTHHGRSLELPAIVGRLWARCGHARLLPVRDGSKRRVP